MKICWVKRFWTKVSFDESFLDFFFFANWMKVYLTGLCHENRSEIHAWAVQDRHAGCPGGDEHHRRSASGERVEVVPPLAQIVAVSGTTGWIDPEIQVEFNRGVWRELLEASRKCCLKQPCRGVEKTDLSSCDIPFHESWCDEFQFARNSRSPRGAQLGVHPA